MPIISALNSHVRPAERTYLQTFPQLQRLLQSALYLFTAARLVPAKGLDLLIDAFKLARLAERNYHCVIAGTGPLEKALKERAGDLLGKNIHLIGFQQPAKNLTLMAHADLFVLPSIYEPHGIVIAESLALPALRFSRSDVCGLLCSTDLVIPGISAGINSR